MIRNRLLFPLVTAGLLLAACTFPITPPPPSAAVVGGDLLAGTGWTLMTLHGESVAGGPPVTLNFGDDGHLGGSDGCNQYSAPYSADEAILSIGQVISTLIACEEPIMQMALDFQAMLGQTATYAIEDDQLTLFDADGQPLATFTAQSTDLAGTNWVITAYNNGQQAVVSVILDSELTADFGADGRLTGSAGCNNYNTSYESDGISTITIGPAAATRMLCQAPAGVMEQETQFLAALESATTYRIDGNQLELRTADDALAVTFQRAQP